VQETFALEEMVGAQAPPVRRIALRNLPRNAAHDEDSFARLQKEARVDLTHHRPALARRAHDDLQAALLTGEAPVLARMNHSWLTRFLSGPRGLLEDERHGR